MEKSPVPRHIGFIPDGNRRWAQSRGLAREAGYAFGVAPGITLFEECRRLGIEEISIYGFTQDNCKRPSVQREAFRKACVIFAQEADRRGGSVLAVGDPGSKEFPRELKSYLTRSGGELKVNLLANYGWEWDLEGLKDGGLRSREVSRLDLIVRWGGHRRLSGFLPVQSVYADFFVHEPCWPDFEPAHLEAALSWYRLQDKTLGG